MYSFADKGGNQLTLRPEGTAPVCRAVPDTNYATLFAT
jgi:histidyl-tRNA synthetase